jgi:hypothetical protein
VRARAGRAGSVVSCSRFPPTLLFEWRTRHQGRRWRYINDARPMLTIGRGIELSVNGHQVNSPAVLASAITLVHSSSARQRILPDSRGIYTFANTRPRKDIGLTAATSTSRPPGSALGQAAPAPAGSRIHRRLTRPSIPGDQPTCGVGGGAAHYSSRRSPPPCSRAR